MGKSGSRIAGIDKQLLGIDMEKMIREKETYFLQVSCGLVPYIMTYSW